MANHSHHIDNVVLESQPKLASKQHAVTGGSSALLVHTACRQWGRASPLSPRPWGTLWWLGSRDDCSGISQAVESPRRRCQNDSKARGNGQPVATEGQVTVTNLSLCAPNKGTAEAQWPFFLQPPLSKTHFSLHSPLPKHLTTFNSALCRVVREGLLLSDY